MALSEQQVLSSVKINNLANSVDVEWQNQILRDGEVISRAFHNKAYSIEHKDDFLAEVEGAASYIYALGW